MDNTIYVPTNYTEAGRLFGMFEIRNAIETVLLGVPCVFLAVSLSPFGLMGTIIAGAVVVVPVCGFALLGVHDYSLLAFIGIYLRWYVRRRIFIYRGCRNELQRKKLDIRKLAGRFRRRR